MDKRFWASIGLVLAVFFGVVVYNNMSDKVSSANATNHVTGATNSKVTMLEYGDFECPVCGVYYPIVQQVEQKYADKVKFQFRNLPIVSAHKNAFAAARAAEAASDQNKFWEMYRLLYQNQDTSGSSGWVASDNPLSDYFTGYAKQLNLDERKFKTAYASQAVNDRINADIAAFKKTGEQVATPTFFLNGTKLENTKLIDSSGSPSVDKFSEFIDAALKKSGQ